MDLQELNNHIQRTFEDDEQSIFRMSFGLQDDVLQAVYAAEEQLPYLRIACWMREVFLHGNGRGFRPHWNEHQSKFKLDDLWHDVFKGQDLTIDNVKSRIWLLLGKEHGYASNIWDVIDLCRNKDEGRDGDIFQPETYRNDCPPKHLKLLLDAYQDDSINGREFAEVILAVRKNEMPEGQNVWYEPLLLAICEMFTKEESLTWDFLLRWVPGSGVATFIVGVESSAKGAHLEIDNENHLIDGAFKSFPVSVGIAHSARYARRRREKKSNGNVVGVYQPYMSSAKDDRKHWWKRIDQDGAVRHDCKHVLVCLENGRDPLPEFESAGFQNVRIADSQVAILAHDGLQQQYFFHDVIFDARPDDEIQLEINGMSTRFAGARPRLWAEGTNSNDIRVDGAVLMGGNLKVVLEHMEGATGCEWEINGKQAEERNVSLEINANSNSIVDCWISCRPIVNGHRKPALHRHIIVLPFEVLEALEGGKSLPNGWTCEPGNSDAAEAVGLRIQNLQAIELTAPDNGTLVAARYTDEPAWWFAAENHQPKINECLDFSRVSDLEAFWVCIPENASKKTQLLVNNEAFSFSGWESKDGIYRIPMVDLCPREGVEYKHGGEVPTVEISLNGRRVCLVKMVPKGPTFCQKDGGGWGVFLPKRSGKRTDIYDVAVWTDCPRNVDELTIAPHVISGENGIEWKSRANDGFVDLSLDMERYVQKHPNGEVFAAFIPRRHNGDVRQKLLIQPFFMEVTGQSFPMKIVQQCETPYSEAERNTAELLHLSWHAQLATLGPGHVMKQSRMWKTFSGNSRSAPTHGVRSQPHAGNENLLPAAPKLGYASGTKYWNVFKSFPETWNQTLWNLLLADYNFLIEPKCILQTTEEELVAHVAEKRFHRRQSKKAKAHVQTGLDTLEPIRGAMAALAQSTGAAASAAGFDASNDEEIKRALKELLKNDELDDDDTVLQEQGPNALNLICEYGQQFATRLIDRAYSSEHTETRKQRLEKVQFLFTHILAEGANDRVLMALVAFVICIARQWANMHISDTAVAPHGEGYDYVLGAVKTAYQHKYVDESPDSEPWQHLLETVPKAHVLLWYVFKKQNLPRWSNR